jgi:hypothetical protein
MLGGSTRIDPGQYKIKVIIIVVLKLDSGVNPWQDLVHGSGESTQVDPGQCKNQSCYYYNFKT